MIKISSSYLAPLFSVSALALSVGTYLHVADPDVETSIPEDTISCTVDTFRYSNSERAQDHIERLKSKGPDLESGCKITEIYTLDTNEFYRTASYNSLENQ